jgi:hypothetical protein
VPPGGIEPPTPGRLHQFSDIIRMDLVSDPPPDDDKVPFMPGWEEASRAITGGIRRELFFCSGEDSVFASLYGGEPASPGPGLVVCPSWGHELRQTLNLCHSLARRLALAGGAGLVLHWPGHGDSGGEPQDTDVVAMAAAASGGLQEARRRAPLALWGLAGVRLGAAAVALAADTADAESLLLIEPSLDSKAFFAELQRASRRASLGARHGREGWAFGHPLPRLDRRHDVASALAGFRGRVACLAYETGPIDPLAVGLEVIRVPGSWEQTKSSTNPRLVDAALDWTISPKAAHA